MKRNILSFFLLAVAFATMVSCGGRKKNPPATEDAGTLTGRPVMVVELSDSLLKHRGADTIDFGRVREGERLMRDFKVRNSGDKALVITRLDLSCGCIDAKYPKQPLKPGEEGEMSLVLDTRGLGGWVYKTATMQTSLGGKPHLLVVIAEIE